MRFRTIVANYGKLHSIGKLILRSTETVGGRKTDCEFFEHQACMKKFELLACKMEREWREIQNKKRP